MEIGIVQEYLPRVTDKGVRVQTAVNIPRHIVCDRLHLAHDIGDTQGRIVQYLRGPLHRPLPNIVLRKCKEKAYGDAEYQHNDEYDGKSEPDRQPMHDKGP